MTELTPEQADAIIDRETYWPQALVGPARIHYDATSDEWQPGQPLYDRFTVTNVARRIFDLLDDGGYMPRYLQKRGLVVCLTCAVAWRCACWADIPDTYDPPDTLGHECPEPCWFCGQAAAA